MVVLKEQKKICGGLFILGIILLTAFAPFLLNASDHEEKCHRYGIPTNIRSGIGMVNEQEALEQARLFAEQKALKKHLAEKAVERFQVAQLIFSFKHNFLVPSQIRALLPQDLVGHLPSIDLDGLALDMNKQLFEMELLVHALAYQNGFGVNLQAAATNPRLALLRVINESGLSVEQTPLEQAKKCVHIALSLDQPETFALTVDELMHLKATLFDHAASIIEAIIKENGFAPYSDHYYDASLSVIQLKHWAAYQEQDLKVSLRYIVDAVERLRTFRQGEDPKWLPIYEKERTAVYELYRDRLWKLVGGEVRSQEAIDQFLACSQSYV